LQFCAITDDSKNLTGIKPVKLAPFGAKFQHQAENKLKTFLEKVSANKPDDLGTKSIKPIKFQHEAEIV